MDYYVSATLSSDVSVASNYKYNYKRDGIFVATGPSVEDSFTRDQ